jgi:hypothetical protein
LVFQLAEIAEPRDPFQVVLERIASLCPAWVREDWLLMRGEVEAY